MAFLIDGKKISSQIKDELKNEVAEMKKEGTEVTLAVIQVGNDPASSVYVGNKKRPVLISVSAPWHTNCLRVQQKWNY